MLRLALVLLFALEVAAAAAAVVVVAVVVLLWFVFTLFDVVAALRLERAVSLWPSLPPLLRARRAVPIPPIRLGV